MQREVPEQPALTDQYLVTVGKLTQNAAITDIVLFCAFKILAGCDDEVGQAIYYALESVAAKARLVRRVVNAAGDEQDATIVDEIVRAVERAHAPRNELAHALLSADGDPGKPWQRLNPKTLKQPMRPVTVAYLKSLMDPSSEAVRAAHAAFDKLCQKRGVPAELKLS
jgi:hypothetical protein